MNEQRFFELLAAYGADTGRWPSGEREAAEAYLANASHRVRDVWESERAFDGILAAEHDVPASINLESRILAKAPAARMATPRKRFWAWNRRQWAAGGVVAASLLMGVAAGYAAEPSATTIGGDYGAMLSLSNASASAVFLSAMNDADGRDD